MFSFARFCFKADSEQSFSIACEKKFFFEKNYFLFLHGMEIHISYAANVNQNQMHAYKLFKMLHKTGIDILTAIFFLIKETSFDGFVFMLTLIRFIQNREQFNMNIFSRLFDDIFFKCEFVRVCHIVINGYECSMWKIILSGN